MPENTFETATGKIDFTLCNNYMFQVVLQNIGILNGVLCSMLDLNPEDIVEIKILNPIIPGREIDAKTFILDIRILLNNATHINLEMQVENEHDWPDRSLNYLCRSFDNLMKGEHYEKVRAAIHIGILDFDVFPEQPEFYSDNKLMNVKSHKIYNDKFELRVLSLNQIQLATEEDKAAGRDRWAELFRATTWEELKMIAAQNPCMEAAAQQLYNANSDYLIRAQAEAVEDYQRKERRIKRQFEEQAAAFAKQASAIAEKDKALAEKDKALAEKDEALVALQVRVAELERQLAQK